MPLTYLFITSVWGKIFQSYQINLANLFCRLSQRSGGNDRTRHSSKDIPLHSPESLNLSTDGYEQYIPPTDTEHEYQGLSKNATDQSLHGGYVNTARNIADEGIGNGGRNDDYEVMP